MLLPGLRALCQHPRPACYVGSDCWGECNVIAAAGRASCRVARPAACLCLAPSSSSPSSTHGATESARTSAAPALLLLPVHAHREPASVPVCACILLAGLEHAGAAEKGHFRVRHFPGVVACPVVKRAARGVGRSSEARTARQTRPGFASAACLGSVADGLLRVGARAHFGRCCMRRCVNGTHVQCGCGTAVGRSRCL